MGGWDRVKIIDFGLVKLIGDVAAAFGAAALTSTGHRVRHARVHGARSRRSGGPSTGATDVYAVGVILFEMLAGCMPFNDPDPMVMMRLHAKLPPPRLDELTHGAPWCTPQLVALVEGALMKEPDHRFASAQVMIAALDDAFASLDDLG